MSAFASEPFTPGGGADFGAFAFPPNSRSSSMCDAPIIDPDFAYIDSFGAYASRDAGLYDAPSWYTDEEPAAPPQQPQQQHQHQQQQRVPPYSLAPILPRTHAAPLPASSDYAQYNAYLQQPPSQQRYAVADERNGSAARQQQQQHALPPSAYHDQQQHSRQQRDGPPLTAAEHRREAHAQPFSQHPQYHPPPLAGGYPVNAVPSPQSSHQSGSPFDSPSPISVVSSSSSSHSFPSTGASNGTAAHKRRASAEGDADGNDAADEDGVDGGKKKAKGSKAAVKKPKVDTAAAVKAAAAGARGRKKSLTSATGGASTPDEPDSSAARALPVIPNPLLDSQSCWFEHQRSASTVWGSSSVLAYVTNTFKNMLLACTVVTQRNTTDIVCFLAHLMEVLPEFAMLDFIRALGYVAHPQPAVDGAPERVVWRAPRDFLPIITLPHRFRLNWARSLESAGPEDPSVINLPTLMWWREREMSFVRKNDFIVAMPVPTKNEAISMFTGQEGAPFSGQTSLTVKDSRDSRDGPDDAVLSPVPLSSTASTPTMDSQQSTVSSVSSLRTSPPPIPSPSDSPSTAAASVAAAPSLPAAAPSLLPSEIDMSQLDLPCHVEVNPSFERMFGYSQAEVKSLFMRYGKQAMARLADPAQLRRLHERDVRGMCEGQNEFSHVVDVHTKYGSGMKTLMHHKLVVGENGMVYKKLYQFVPLTKGLNATEDLPLA